MADIGLVVGIEFGEGGKVLILHQNVGRTVHRRHVQRDVILPGSGSCKGILARFDIIAVLPLPGTETGVGIGRDRHDTAYGDIAGKHMVELENDLFRIGDGRGSVEMRHVIGGIHSRIGASGTGQQNRFTEQGRDCPFDRLLYRRHIGLPLPTAIGSAVVSQFDKITHRFSIYHILQAVPAFREESQPARPESFDPEPRITADRISIRKKNPNP